MREQTSAGAVSPLVLVGFPCFRLLSQGQQFLYSRGTGDPAVFPAPCPRLKAESHSSARFWVETLLGTRVDTLGREALFSLRSPHCSEKQTFFPLVLSLREPGRAPGQACPGPWASSEPWPGLAAHPQICDDLTPWEAQPQHLGPLSSLSPRGLPGWNLQTRGPWGGLPTPPCLTGLPKR